MAFRYQTESIKLIFSHIGDKSKFKKTQNY